jgi:hypothetical protein
MSKIVYEEDIEAAHALAESILGPNGNVIYPPTKHTVFDAKVQSDEHGTLWYGDLNEGSESLPKLNDLSAKLGVEVWVRG